MKKTTLCSIILLISLLVSCSPTIPQPERNIVYEAGVDPAKSLMSYIADTDSFEVTTELSTQILKCKILSCQNVKVNSLNEFVFHYEVEIEEIFLDIRESLETGTTITVSSTEGIFPAQQAAELVKNSEHAKKFGYLQGNYTSSDYVLASSYNAIPIEIGHTYILYLTDKYVDSEGVYTDIGKNYLFECRDGEIYYGKHTEKMNISEKALNKQIKNDVVQRTGRVQEIGQAEYLAELGKRQAQALREKLETESDNN